MTENVLHSTKISPKSAPDLRFLEGFSVFWHFVEALQHFFSSLLISARTSAVSRPVKPIRVWRNRISSRQPTRSVRAMWRKPGPGHRQGDDRMVAGDQAHRAVRPGQGPCPAEPADDLVRADRNVGKDFGHRAAQIICLGVVTAGAVGVRLGNVACPRQHFPCEGVKQVHPPLRRAETDHPAVQRPQPCRTVDHQMLPATAAHQLPGQAGNGIHPVGPGPARSHDDPCAGASHPAAGAAPDQDAL